MSSEDQKKELRKPCAECPYRRGTQHNGGSPPEVYVGQAMGPFLLSCHLSPGYWKNPRGTEHAQCAGAAIFRANIHRAEVMPESMLKLPQDTEAVFSSSAEMVAHHRQISVEEAQAQLQEETPEQLMRKEFLAAGVQVVAVPSKASCAEQARFKPNTLVAYKGGGYDGCIYEWNYAYIDSQGEFHSFYASGSMGCETLEELNEAYVAAQERILAGRRSSANDIDLYDFDNLDECRRFVDREPVDNVLRIAALLHEGRHKVQLLCACDKCGKEMNLVTAKYAGANPHGVGGIEVRNRNIVCNKCAYRLK